MVSIYILEYYFLYFCLCFRTFVNLKVEGYFNYTHCILVFRADDFILNYLDNINVCFFDIICEKNLVSAHIHKN